MNAMPFSANSGLASERVRARMVQRVRELGVRDARVLAALEAVPRHMFVDAALASRAYEDSALPIGHGQTISQPYMVARCAELALEAVADPKAAHVLEIGTGCGYAAAVLAHIFGQVWSVERIKALHQLARERLRPLRIANLHLILGDGTAGCKEGAPFDALIAAAAGAEVPPAWVAQLKTHGRIVAPLGGADPASGPQRLCVLTRDERGQVSQRVVEPVRFVPLKTGVV
ncbi:MAG TPA: protein-L-isoaspartate(D-aspartate) O-methyltransferase [Burkholderiaceae bacterium]|nr:protein-L-isoaspartate(D-aspartate) O-methyltransferase [Burkholderiaceae bacterium]